MIVRTRFAPSPTGSLHMGGARTALFNQLLAHSKQGKVILRIEDTDQERSKESFKDQLIYELSWLGLSFDEGRNAQGEQGAYGPYTQSQRYEIYQSHAKKLIEEKKAYYCFASDEDIEIQRAKAKHIEAFQFQSPYKTLPLDDAKKKLAQGEKAVIRFDNKNPNQSYIFNDLVRGEIKLPTSMVGDFIILRKDGSPVYNFCCAIDDALMNITDVLRGEEHLSNTLRQLMILEALALKAPNYGHLSLIMGNDGKKLSKRTGAKCISDFISEGYLPQGIINALALLGWSHPDGEEILSHEELQASFSAKRLNPAPPMFDETKLKWINQMHIRKLSPEELIKAITPFLDQAQLNLPYDEKWMVKATNAFSQDWQTLRDAQKSFSLFTENPAPIEENAKENIPWDTAYECIKAWADIIEAQNHDPHQPLPNEVFQEILKSIGKKLNIKGKMLFMPIRMALVGKAQGIDLKTAISLFSLQQLKIRAHFYQQAFSACYKKDQSS